MKLFAISSIPCAVLIILLSVQPYGVLTISSDAIDLSQPLDEFHDLDDMYSEEDGDSMQPESHADYGPNNRDVDGYDLESVPDKIQQDKPGSKHIIDRFSQIVSRQILDRFQLPLQIRLPTFPFQLPWDRRRDKVKAVPAEINSKVSLVDMNSVKKIAALCPPNPQDTVSEDDAPAAVDESLVVCEPDTAQTVLLGNCEVPDDTIYDNSVLDDDEIQAGMIVYVLQSIEMLDGEDYMRVDDTSISTIHEGNGLSFNSDNQQIASSRCIVEMGKRFDTNENVVQYSLIRREFHELGNADVHKKDFAYQPVVLNKDDLLTGWEGFGFSREYTSDGHELETRTISPESDEAVEVLQFNPGYYSPDAARDNDQQVSFRWWSWIDHFNQFFRQEHGDYAGQSLYSGAITPGSQRNYDGQSAYERNLYEEEGKRAFAGGSHGEIWKARRRCPTKRVDCDDKKDYIVKRLKIELGFPVLEAGLREVYFGELLGREAESSNLLTRYVDHFFREGKKGQVELWIVFENAGPSLRSYLYTSVVDADMGFTVFQHSPFWRRLRKSIKESNDDADFALDIIRPLQKEGAENHTSKQNRDTSSSNRHGPPEGRLLLRDVMKQILTSVAFLHERGIVHR
jgi:hypothetical protein